MQMFHAVIQIGEAHPCHASVTLLQGDAVNVDGQRMVRTSTGFIHPDSEWCESEAEAYSRASVKLLAIASGIASRADEMRQTANEMLAGEAAS